MSLVPVDFPLEGHFTVLTRILGVQIVVVVTVSCLTLCNPMDCGPPGSSAHGILQARILEWVAMPSSRGSSWHEDWTQVSWTAGRFFFAGRFFTVWAIGSCRETRYSAVYKLLLRLPVSFSGGGGTHLEFCEESAVWVILCGMAALVLKGTPVPLCVISIPQVRRSCLLPLVWSVL